MLYNSIFDNIRNVVKFDNPSPVEIKIDTVF